MGWIKDNTNKDPIAKKGMRIRMLFMDDESAVDTGMEGTISWVDSLGTLHVKWDDGKTMGVIPNEDKYQLLPPEDEQITPDEFMSIFNENKGKRIFNKLKKDPISKPIKNLFDKIKIESEKIKGGEALRECLQKI